MAEERDRTPFGELLRNSRRSARMTQAELAASAGFSTVYIGMLERGERLPHMTTVGNLSRALSLTDYQEEELRSAAFGSSTALDGRLPNPLTSFVGRRREIAVLCDMLREPDVRLLTLVGSGGIGKTRLATEIARRLRQEFDDGVFFVPLDTVTRPESVPSAMAAALGVKPRRDTPTSRALLEHLEHTQLLLVLDNFEHLVPAATGVAALLSGAPRCRVLATSRVRLGQSGEHVFDVPPLSAPSELENHEEEVPVKTSGASVWSTPNSPPRGNGIDAVGAVAECDAGRLFVDRVQSVDASFVLSRLNAIEIAKICNLLDGLPLALELAAARAHVFPLDMIVAQLRQPILQSSDHEDDARPRHGSLSATFEWSYRLLDEPLRRVFAMLSVFVGGFTLQATTELLGPADDDAIDAVARLVDASLLRPVEGRSGRRFVMLRPVRDFALGKLRTAGGEEQARRSHIDIVVRLAEQFAVEGRGYDSEAWFRRLEDEKFNVIAALEWCADSEPMKGLAIAGATVLFWEAQAYRQDCLRLLESMLTKETVVRHVDDSEAPSVRATLARAYAAASSLSWAGGNEAAARQYGDEALDLYKLLPESPDHATAVIRMGNAHMLGGRVEAAREFYRQALRIREGLGDVMGIYGSLNNLGVVELALGDYKEAARLLRQAIDLSRSNADPRSAARALNNLGFALLYQGSLDEALQLGREALRLRHEVDDAKGIAESFELLAGVLAGQAEHGVAAHLLGAADRIRTDKNIAYGLAWLEGLVEQIKAGVVNAIGRDDFNALCSQGARSNLDEMVQVALGIRKISHPTSDSLGVPDPQTPAPL